MTFIRFSALMDENAVKEKQEEQNSNTEFSKTQLIEVFLVQSADRTPIACHSRTEKGPIPMKLLHLPKHTSTRIRVLQLIEI